MVGEHFDNNPNNFLNEIARDRYLLSGPATALRRLRENIDEFLKNVSRIKTIDAKMDFVANLKIMAAALRGLNEISFTLKELKLWEEKFCPEFVQKLTKLKEKSLDPEITELADQLIKSVQGLDPELAISMFNLDYDAVARKLLTPIGLTLAAGLVLTHGAKDPVEEKSYRYIEAEAIPMSSPLVIDEAVVETEKLQTFIKKIRESIARGTFDFNSYFNELETEFEHVTSRDAADGEKKFIDILETVIKKYLQLPDVEYMQKISGFAKSPADDLDNRNSRASSNELLADVDTIGNCEARARTTYRIIEKTRPDLLKHIAVIKWKKHEAIAYVAKDGAVYQFDAGHMWRIPDSLTKKIILLSPQQAWVDPLVRPAHNGTYEFDHKDTSTAIHLDSSDAPEMPKEYDRVKKTHVMQEKKNHSRSDLVIDWFEKRIEFNMEFGQQFEFSGDPTVIGLSVSQAAIKEGNIFTNLKRLHDFHHITRLSFGSQLETAKTQENDGDGNVLFNPAPFLEAIRKMDLKELSYASNGSSPLLLSDFDNFKNIKHAEIEGWPLGNVDAVSFVKNHRLTQLAIDTRMLTDEMVDVLLTQQQLQLLEIKSPFASEDIITSLDSLPINKMIEMRKRGFTGMYKINIGRLRATPEMLKVYREGYKKFFEINDRLPVRWLEPIFGYTLDEKNITDMEREISALTHEVPVEKRRFLLDISNNKLSTHAIRQISRLMSDYQDKISFGLRVTPSNAQNENLFDLFEACSQMEKECDFIPISETTGGQLTYESLGKLPHWKLGASYRDRGVMFVK